MFSSDSLLIQVIDNIVTDVVFSGIVDRELTSEEKNLIRLGLKSATLREILEVLFELERLELRKIAKRIVSDNKDIILDKTKYATAQIGDIGVMIHFLVDYIGGFSEEILMSIREIIRQKITADNIDEIVIFLKSMDWAGILESAMEIISDRLAERIRKLSFIELVKLLYWAPVRSFEKVLELSKNDIRKCLSSATPKQLEMLLSAFHINPTKVNTLLKHLEDERYPAGFGGRNYRAKSKAKKKANGSYRDITIIFHSKVEKHTKEIVISTIKETFNVNIKIKTLPRALEDFLEIFKIRDIYMAFDILYLLSKLYNNIFLIVAPYKIIVEEALIETDLYTPAIKGGMGMHRIGAIVSVYPEATKKGAYIYNATKHELGHVFGIINHCENNCVMEDTTQEKPMHFCEKCQQILIKKEILKAP